MSIFGAMNSAISGLTSRSDAFGNIRLNPVTTANVALLATLPATPAAGTGTLEATIAMKQ